VGVFVTVEDEKGPGEQSTTEPKAQGKRRSERKQQQREDEKGQSFEDRETREFCHY